MVFYGAQPGRDVCTAEGKTEDRLLGVNMNHYLSLYIYAKSLSSGLPRVEPGPGINKDPLEWSAVQLLGSNIPLSLELLLLGIRPLNSFIGIDPLERNWGEAALRLPFYWSGENVILKDNLHYHIADLESTQAFRVYTTLYFFPHLSPLPFKNLGCAHESPPLAIPKMSSDSLPCGFPKLDISLRFDEIKSLD